MASPSCTHTFSTIPPTLKESRVSSLVVNVPLDWIGAEKVVAFRSWRLTGITCPGAGVLVSTTGLPPQESKKRGSKKKEIELYRFIN